MMHANMNQIPVMPPAGVKGAAGVAFVNSGLLGTEDAPFSCLSEANTSLDGRAEILGKTSDPDILLLEDDDNEERCGLALLNSLDIDSMWDCIPSSCRRLGETCTGESISDLIVPQDSLLLLANLGADEEDAAAAADDMHATMVGLVRTLSQTGLGAGMATRLSLGEPSAKAADNACGGNQILVQEAELISIAASQHGAPLSSAVTGNGLVRVASPAPAGLGGLIAAAAAAAANNSKPAPGQRQPQCRSTSVELPRGASGNVAPGGGGRRASSVELRRVSYMLEQVTVWGRGYLEAWSYYSARCMHACNTAGCPSC